MECIACGRRLTNAEAENQAAWTLEPLLRLPYCADSDQCQQDAEDLASGQARWEGS